MFPHPYLACGQSAQDDALKKRGEKTGDAKQRAPAFVHRIMAGIVFAKDEGGTAKHDADEHESQRNMQSSHHGSEGPGKAGEEENNYENQPDVVCFPNGADGMIDGVPLATCARAKGEHIPHAAAEISATEQCIKNQGDQ